MTSSPSIDAEKLTKILQLERQRNYDNKAVFGGLDRYLQRWAAENRAGLSSPRLLVQFNRLKLDMSNYASLDVDQRQAWLKAVLSWLVDTEKVEKPVRKSRTISPSATGQVAISKTRSPDVSAGLDAPVTVLKGVAASMAAKLARLGVKKVRDLLYLFPRYHLDYSQRKPIAELEVGEEQTVLATVWEASIRRLGGYPGTEIFVSDETGSIRAVWFNQPYLAKKFPTNAKVMLSGRVSEFRNNKVFESPDWELVEDKELIHAGRLVPVYPLTRGLYPRQMRTLMRQAVGNWVGQVIEFLPPSTKNSCHFMALPEAIAQAHFPDSRQSNADARRRLAFDELFLLQLGVLNKKKDWQESQPGNAFNTNQKDIDRFQNYLPFTLTGAQQRVLQEVSDDLRQSRPMTRLLQGDVGSGKTVIAMAALLLAVDNGYQGALMVPTEILADQHFRNICQLLSRVSTTSDGGGNICRYEGFLSRPVTFALLTGSLSAREKKTLHQLIRDGSVDIVIGTHALVQKGVEFHKLGLAVIDEQHRFGVLQRSELRQKGFNPHVLVMTATPIPRTLALTLYGDLDLSVIDEVPPGRQKIETRWLSPDDRNAAYGFIRRQITSGQQAFIICPLVEESENIEARAAVAEYEQLSSEVFRELRLGLLHGRMSASDKDAIMQSFRDGKIDILVSTAVVEVGIDVPNATVMLVEAADRFGLSQLHQFRGRVGRGEKKSYCLLLAENPSPEGRERLRAIEQTHNGFELAETDLKLRGPGEFFGTRQSGLPDLRMARLSDTHLLELARSEAIALFNSDPDLKLPEHYLLLKELTRSWQEQTERS